MGLYLLINQLKGQIWKQLRNQLCLCQVLINKDASKLLILICQLTLHLSWPWGGLKFNRNVISKYL